MKRIKPIKIVGGVAYITLTQGYTAKIDVCDVPLVDGLNWHAKVYHDKLGAVARVYAARNFKLECGRVTIVRMHQLIMDLSSGLVVDHANGDGTDNRRGNLRPATITQNNRNRGKTVANTSGFKGVTWDKRQKGWVAQIQVDKKCVRLGHFLEIDAAAQAYASASSKFHGDFGRAI